MTLEEFEAKKKSKSSGILKKAEARQPEEVKKPNLEKATTEKQRVEPIASHLKGSELYNAGVAKTDTAGLLAF
jgi:hypothetical protein